MKRYEKPVMEVVEIDNEVIVTSVCDYVYSCPGNYDPTPDLPMDLDFD